MYVITQALTPSKGWLETILLHTKDQSVSIKPAVYTKRGNQIVIQHLPSVAEVIYPRTRDIAMTSNMKTVAIIIEILEDFPYIARTRACIITAQKGYESGNRDRDHVYPL